MTQGKFIFFEGMDFSGKTTCLNLLASILTERGIPFIKTREPGGSALAEKIRNILLGETTINEAESALLFQVARSHHCRTVIQPALDQGMWVLSDRYIISSMVYQHTQMELLETTTRTMNLIEPDFMFYARCGKQTTLERKGVRQDNNHLDEKYTQMYDVFSERFDHYACLLEDMSLTIDTNETQEEIRMIFCDFVDKILGDKNV